MITKKVKITNKRGLHARAAAKFVNTASAYSASVSAEVEGKQADGKSIMGVMMLSASKGKEINLTIVGQDEHEACKALENLVVNRFEEEE